MNRRVLIFGWHNVESTWAFPSPPEVALAGMRRQFEFLARTAHVVDLSEAVGGLRGDSALPSRAAVITFDDGYRDNLELAAPLLTELGLPATFFLCPEFLSGTAEPWWERLGRAMTTTEKTRLEWQGSDLSLDGPAARDAVFGRLSADLKTIDESARQAAVSELVQQLGDGETERAVAMLDWHGAGRLSRLGFTIGSHSARHVILANETPEDQREDLRSARQRLESGLGIKVDLLAYPNGTTNDYSSDTITAAEEAGYRAAVTTTDGWNSRSTPRFELRRFVMYPEWGAKGFGVVPREPVRQLRKRLRRSRYLERGRSAMASS